MKNQITKTHPLIDVSKKARFEFIKSKLFQTTTVGLVAVAAISFTSIKIYKTTLPESYPANHQCLKLSSELPKYYQGQTNLVFGTPLVEGSLTKTQIDALVADCELHKNEITLQVSK